MAEIKKYLDLEGLKKVFGIVDEKISGATATLNTEIAKKANSSDVYSKGEVDEKIAETIAGSVDLTPYLKSADAEETYAKKSEIPTDFYSKEEVDEAISDAKEAILGEDLKDALDTLETVKSWKEEHGTEYTNLLAEVNKKADAETVASTYATKEELEGYQTKGDYALKSELPSVEGLASESYVNGKIAEVEGKIPTDYLTDEDIEDLASEEYVDDAIEEALAPYAKTADLPSFVAFSDAEIEAASKGE